MESINRPGHTGGGTGFQPVIKPEYARILVHSDTDVQHILPSSHVGELLHRQGACPSMGRVRSDLIGMVFAFAVFASGFSAPALFAADANAFLVFDNGVGRGTPTPLLEQDRLDEIVRKCTPKLFLVSITGLIQAKASPRPPRSWAREAWIPHRL